MNRPGRVSLIKCRLDVRTFFSWSYSSMKRLILAGLAAVTLVAAGCVKTVDDSHTGAIWFGRDKFTGHYQRSVEQVYAASVRVVNQNGALVSEFIPHDSTNTVRSLQAKVNNQNVWIRVEGISTTPLVTSGTVQARSPAGVNDEVLAHDLEKEIALALVH